MLWIIVGIVVALAISAFIAACFADVAREKGFNDSLYFWMCAIFGIAGYLLVIALPDRKIKIAPAQSEMHTAPTTAASQRPLSKQHVPEGQKVCWACGKVQPAYNVSCSNCGEVL
jgi:hypothetical protein